MQYQLKYQYFVGSYVTSNTIIDIKYLSSFLVRGSSAAGLCRKIHLQVFVLTAHSAQCPQTFRTLICIVLGIQSVEN